VVDFKQNEITIKKDDYFKLINKY